MRRLYARTFKLFASLRLTLFIMVGLSAGLVTGMFWDQTKTLGEHLRNVTSPLARKIFLFLELNDVFHSWWFGILVLLLALNLIGCSISRLPKIWIDARNPHKKLDNYILRKASQKKTFTLKAEPKSPIFSDLEERWVENNTKYVFFEKQKYARCGVYVIHTALLFLMFGSIFATQTGIDGMMMISEGSTSQIVQAKGPGGRTYSHRLNFVVKCDDFRLRTYTDGSPMDYESDLSIYRHSDMQNPVTKQTIRVNEPLEFEGYTFYQASYQPLDGKKFVNLRIGPHGEKLEHYQVEQGDLKLMSPGNIQVTELYEDYAGLGPAVQVKQADAQFVVFRKYPDFDSQVRRGEWDVVFSGFDEPYATGVSVAKVPGLWAVFAGFIIMFIGLYMAFGMNQRRYYARITRLANNQFELCLAGISHRYPQAFEKEFLSLVTKQPDNFAHGCGQRCHSPA